MAETRKVLGQLNPSAATLTALYTVPGATQTVVSTLTACNQSAVAPAKVRISVAIAGAADDVKQYVSYDLLLAANETQGFTLGITLGTTDVIRVYSDTGLVSFNAFGVEIA